MSRKKHILPNNTKVAIFFDKVRAGEGVVVSHYKEKSEDNPKRYDLYYEVKIQRTLLEIMFNFPDVHVVNSFELKPIK